MPKTHGNLFDRIVDFDNLWHAYLAARSGKRYRREVAHFAVNLEENLLNLHNHLVQGSWQPGKSREFRIFEPKQRDIQAPPFADRIVHHALVRVVEPLFDRVFIHHSYACRKGKGAQRAVRALQGKMRVAQRQHETPYVIKSDIKSYFASINHEILFSAIGRVISCRKTLALWRKISRAYGHQHDVGLPVGALTSQLAANVLLDQLDHAMTDHAGIGDYVRYMDDCVIVAKSKPAAQAILVHLADEVAALGLQLNPKTCIYPARQGVDFCGYRTFTTHTLPRKRNVQRARRDFRKLADDFHKGKATLADARKRVASFIAYVKHCNANHTASGLLEEFILTKPNGENHAQN